MLFVVAAFIFAVEPVARAQAPLGVTSVSGFQIQGYQYGGATATIKVYASEAFLTADGRYYVGGAPRANAGFFLTINCTVLNGVLTVPAFQIPVTTNSPTRPNVTLTFVLFDSRNIQRDVLLANAQVRATLGAATTWELLQLSTASAIPYRGQEAVSKDEFYRLLNLSGAGGAVTVPGGGTNNTTFTGARLVQSSADGTRLESSSINPANVVDATTTSTITGAKTFTQPIVGSVTGSSATATTATNLVGSGSTSNAVDLATGEVAGVLPNARTTATSANTPNTIAARDGTGTIGANLNGDVSGNATSATTATTATNLVGSGSTSNAVDLASAETAGVLPETKGGLGLSAVGAQGTALFSTGTGYAPTTITPGSNITITRTAGDLTINASGTLSTNADAFRGVPLAVSAPTDGQVYRYKTDTGLWTPETISLGTSVNTPNEAVRRDGSGDFAAGTITAALNGNAATATSAANATTAATSATADAYKGASSPTATQFNFLAGVTSAIQTQLNGKQPVLGYTPVNRAGDTLTGALSADVASSSNSYTGLSITARQTIGVPNLSSVAIFGQAISNGAGGNTVTGVYGLANGSAGNSYAVRAYANGGANSLNYGIYAEEAPDSIGNNVTNVAGRFVGDVQITGTMSAGLKNFVIDHVLPAKRDDYNLVYAAVEMPRLKVMIDGDVTLVAGVATVSLDAVASQTTGTFAALTRGARCLVQNRTSFTPVLCSVTDGTLTISTQGTTAIDAVTFLVTAERKDAYVMAQHALNPTAFDANGSLIPEQLKPTISAAVAQSLMSSSVETVEAAQGAPDRTEQRVASELVGTRGYPIHASVTGVGAKPMRQVTVRTVQKSANQ